MARVVIMFRLVLGGPNSSARILLHDSFSYNILSVGLGFQSVCRYGAKLY
jgi:hypothetical protein